MHRRRYERAALGHAGDASDRRYGEAFRIAKKKWPPSPRVFSVSATVYGRSEGMDEVYVDVT